jgi:hypothetical protein
LISVGANVVGTDLQIVQVNHSACRAEETTASDTIETCLSIMTLEGLDEADRRSNPPAASRGLGDAETRNADGIRDAGFGMRDSGFGMRDARIRD